MYQGDTAPWLEFYAWDDDGSAKTDLDASTTGLSIVVQRDNLADSSALSLSDASGPTDWAAGKIHQMGSGNKYRVGISTASISSYDGKISVGGSYTGGVITGTTEIVSVVDPGDGAAAGLSKFADIETDTQNIQSRIPAVLVSGRMDADVAVLQSAAVASIWNSLTSGMTTAGSIGKKIADWVVGQLATSQPNYAPAKAGDQMDLVDSPNATAITAIQSGLGTLANQTTLLGRLTASRAGYLDNLNVGGAVANQADINALNQSASRRAILTVLAQWERPESGNFTKTIECRTWDGDGVPTNADSTPTIAVTGTTSGDLSGNLSAASNPSAGVYQWTYTDSSSATLEDVRIEVSPTIGGTAYPVAAFSQVVDLVSATWTSSDASKLTAIYDKLPTKPTLAGTANADGDIELDEATGVLGNVVPADGSITAAKFDQSTAYPIRQEDSGATAVARTGADGDTLENLSDEIEMIVGNSSTHVHTEGTNIISDG